MNERIKDLAVQIGFPMGYDNPAWAYEQDIYKFAELIVRECGDWIINNASSIEHLGPEYFVKAMKQHFDLGE